jgi:hypothetical protein
MQSEAGCWLKKSVLISFMLVVQQAPAYVVRLATLRNFGIAIWHIDVEIQM